MTLVVLNRSAPAVGLQPEVRLVGWQIFRLPSGDHHFCGLHADRSKGFGRVSTAIVSFDAATRTGTTASGRRYVLEGEPGAYPAVDGIRALWLRARGFDPTEIEAVDTVDIGHVLH